MSHLSLPPARSLALWFAGLVLFACLAGAQAATPVILDTDIGDDIDDTWALGLALRSPELDVKLVLGDYGKSDYRAKLIARFLEKAGRTDIPVGLAPEFDVHGVGPQAAWVKDYDLKRYPGKIHADGIQAMIDVILQSKEPVTVIAIGPVPNLARALEREPRLAQKARFVGMHGSVRVGYGSDTKVVAEYNVRCDARACQKAFQADWPKLITPLDTCGLVQLQGSAYSRVRDSRHPVARAILENYRLWEGAREGSSGPGAAEAHSSTLFDTVAVYLAIRQDWVKLEDLRLSVTEDGFTKIDPAGKSVSVATAWKDLEAFHQFLANRLGAD